MASSRQEYFILRNDMPNAKTSTITNNFWKNLLVTMSADCVVRGELLVKEALPQESSHLSRSIYSLALDRRKKVSCSNSDVIPLSKDDYEWLAAIGKTIDRWQVYVQGDKLEAVKKLQVGEIVRVTITAGVGTPPHLPATSCCHATVQYIGPLQDTPGRWVGVELKENQGNCDGSYRDSRYFMCDDGYGAFLPASSILTPKKLLVASTKTKTDQDFYLDDPVVVFDKDGRRVPGVAKWAVSGKEHGVDCYIIGIETDMPIKKEKVKVHISKMVHLFPHKPDCKKHTHLAIPEVSLLKEYQSAPPDALSEAVDFSNPTDVTVSVHAVPSTVAKSARSTTAAFLHEHAQALKESEAKKEETANKEVAEELDVTPEELDDQREQYKKLEQQQSLHDQKCELYQAVAGSGASGEDQEHIADSQGGAVRAVAVAKNTRSATATESQPQPTQPLPHVSVSHNLEVGSAVELLDPPGYGIIRWIGKFPGVGEDMAGVELDTRMDGCGDGSWNGEQYFSGRDGHAVFIVLSKLKLDSRFVQQPQEPNQPSMEMSCSCECQLIKDQVTEIKTGLCYQEDNVKEIDCQIKEYIRQNRLLREELTTVKGQVGSCEEALQASKEALQAKDQQIERLQSEVQTLQLTTTQFQASSFTEKRQLTEEVAIMQRQLISCEDTKNQQIQELQQTIADLRKDHHKKENEFTARLSSIEAQMTALLPPWAIPETELEVTETILGKGAYGEVRVGVYHGDRVAVKRLHTVIASEYYHRMIQREMGIAARLRHPKLVLFIGAVTRGNLTIVTELMETSLRSELEHSHLKEDHILPVSRDVACALCYLHSLPEPIIHRDVSSANVLLNSTKGGWVAKLGDYGSANFQAKLQTVGPGCPVYAAPEASRPEEQGPKMDVYSYGVLLLEMCTGTLPDPRDLPVIQQAVHSWGQPKRQLGGLACQCTLQSSDRRPHMRNVVTQLNGM